MDRRLRRPRALCTEEITSIEPCQVMSDLSTVRRMDDLTAVNLFLQSSRPHMLWIHPQVGITPKIIKDWMQHGDEKDSPISLGRGRLYPCCTQLHRLNLPPRRGLRRRRGLTPRASSPQRWLHRSPPTVRWGRTGSDGTERRAKAPRPRPTRHGPQGLFEATLDTEPILQDVQCEWRPP